MICKSVLTSSLFAICAASLAVAGCGHPADKDEDGGRTIELTAEEYRFSPAQITAEPGERLNIALRNNGKKEHSIEFDVPGENEALERNVAPGDTAHLSFNAPSKAGNYPFFSPLGDDRKRGLEGRLDVTTKQTRR